MELESILLPGVEAKRPIVIAGPCSAETEEQVMTTAKELASKGMKIFRAGIWKPRTKPGGFEGIGVEGLAWLKEVKKETGMYVSTEVATAKHVYECLKAGIDILWVGARTTANPFAVQEIADALKGVDIPVLVKNPVNPDLELWIGALERIHNAGLKRLGAIHRGFSSYDKKIYRNLPQWHIPIELRRRLPNLPIFCDPSHIGGKRELVAPLCQQAMDLNFDGLIVESHCNPDCAWSDASQQVTPDVLDYILNLLVIRTETQTTESLSQLRKQIDECDDNIIQELAKRMRQIVWKRCEDMNDRVLRNIVVGLGNKTDGFVREDHFVITVASEIMAILCLADDMKDLKERLSRIVVAYNYQGEPVTAGQLKAVGAMAALLKDAIKPNLIQTLEHTPALVHGGPFANIAHGCNSVRATKAAMKMADYCITEAGFGADLGAEKFFDIKCRKAGLTPDAVVLVATIRALKYNGGVAKADLGAENLEALKKGIVNLEKHIENLQKYGVPVVVTLNSFITDSEAETAYVREFCETRGCEFALSEVWEKGGEGGIALAEKVLKAIDEKENHFHVLYENELSLQDKIKKIAQEIYGASDVVFAPAAAKQLKRLTELGFGDLPVCMAKNQYSLSDDPTLLGRPSGFELNVREVYVSAGAGFVVVLTGAVMTMPGLPKAPAAYNIDVDDSGRIVGLF